MINVFDFDIYNNPDLNYVFVDVKSVGGVFISPSCMLYMHVF